MLNKARELKKYTLGLIKSEKHFPKSTRWIYASPIVNEIREACVCIRHANSVFVTNDEEYTYRRMEQVKAHAHLDHFIKERLRIKHYIRYMDDFILVHEDKEYLRQCKKEIEARLFALGLQLNDKTALYPLRQGVKLLQWRFIVTDTGAIIRKMGKKKQSKQRRKLKKLYAKERRGEYAPGTAHESLVSWLANAARGDTYHERLKMINYFKNMEATYNAREYL